MKVLLVEDEPTVGKLFANLLRHHCYTVDLADNGELGWMLANQGTYDVILLDLLMPGLDGLSFCRRLRRQGDTTPLLMLTGQNSSADIVAGLDAGADDYVTKPCEPDQLMARIRAVTRRAETGHFETRLCWGDLQLDPGLIRVTYQQVPIHLGPKEYGLLELFLRQPQRIFTRDSVIDALWTIDDTPSPAAVTNLVKDLRRKLKAAGLQASPIETVHRIGYRLKSAPAVTSKPLAQTYSSGLGMKPMGAKLRPSLQQQLDDLDAIATTLINQPDPEHWRQLRNTCHRLIGSLGVFGYLQGSAIARTLEHLSQAALQQASPAPTAALQQLSQHLADLRQALTINVTPLSLPPIDNVWVAVLGRLSPLVPALQAVAGRWEIRVTSLSLEDAAPPSPLPAAMICDWQESDSLQQILQRVPGVPLIVLTQNDDLATRVAIAQTLTPAHMASPPVRCLPQSVSPNHILATATQLITTAARPQPRIMVIDDDPTFLQAISGLLTRQGLQVTPLQEFQQGWQQLQQSPPDCLLLDISLPNFNGLDLCRILRQDARLQDLPIMLVSAHQDRAILEQAFAVGADDFLTKPITGVEVIGRIEQRLRHRRPIGWGFSPAPTVAVHARHSPPSEFQSIH